MGYFQLALAAALQDGANPEALYVVYMKLAEIHCNHMPDAQLCQHYRDRAQSLKRVLAVEESAVVEEENRVVAQRENCNPDVECTDSNFMSVPENEKSKDVLSLRTCEIHEDTENTCLDDNNGDANEKSDDNINLPETECRFLEASASETTASQSYSDSTFTESFDTAKEQISDSCSSTDTLQADHSQTNGKDFENAHSMSGHMALIYTDDKKRLTHDSNIHHDENTLNEKTDTTDCIHKDVSTSNPDRRETTGVRL